jgi:hypothetical protein
MSEFFISIVIPVYEEEKQIRRPRYIIAEKINPENGMKDN